MDLELAVFRQATHGEFLRALEWAAKEGWNPGLGDADTFWHTDPEGFVCIELGDEVVGTGSIVSYGTFAFMGFFIVRPDLRGQGLGARFWHWRKARLLDRLKPGTAVGMDGVFDMQDFYAKGGFVFSHRNLRMAGTAVGGTPSLPVTPLAEIPFEHVCAMDLRCFGFAREDFLRRWIHEEHGVSLGIVQDGVLQGFGVIRECCEGYKIGPLFAASTEVADALYVALSSNAAGQPVYLDVPEINPAAMALAERYGLKEVFGCARMYLGPAPQLPWQSIFGITTFELG
ncbi:GNAT family N-acetyltransferase [Coraliomargarita parva]|uniref:GNAT family N-acetyltransferase n=1 Tax=Coraliomargarita parva TaxID=3014050 RepID=UPI0022B3CA98|nr:GNAT family N-acetyltransferase [Coraliomargarita parva]